MPHYVSETGRLKINTTRASSRGWNPLHRTEFFTMGSQSSEDGEGTKTIKTLPATTFYQKNFSEVALLRNETGINYPSPRITAKVGARKQGAAPKGELTQQSPNEALMGKPVYQRAQKPPAWGGTQTGVDIVKKPAVAKPAPPKKTPVVKTPPPTSTINWVITYAARNHYKDGWEAVTQISSDDELKDAIQTSGSEPRVGNADNEEIFLGQGKVKGKFKGCNILYNRTWNGNVCTILVRHCGPTKGAG